MHCTTRQTPRTDGGNADGGSLNHHIAETFPIAGQAQHMGGGRGIPRAWRKRRSEPALQVAASANPSVLRPALSPTNAPRYCRFRKRRQPDRANLCPDSVVPETGRRLFDTNSFRMGDGLHIGLKTRNIHTGDGTRTWIGLGEHAFVEQKSGAGKCSPACTWTAIRSIDPHSSTTTHSNRMCRPYLSGKVLNPDAHSRQERRFMADLVGVTESNQLNGSGEKMNNSTWPEAKAKSSVRSSPEKTFAEPSRPIKDSPGLRLATTWTL